MKSFYQLEKRLNALANGRDITFIYINGRHDPYAWQNKAELSTCKLNLFMEGESHIIIGEKTYEVHPGDVLLYRPREIHFGNIPYAQNIEYFELQFAPSAFDHLACGKDLMRFFSTHDAPDRTHIRPKEAGYRALCDLFYRAKETLEAGGEFSDMKAYGMILEILCTIRTLKDSTDVPTGNTKFYPAPLISAINYINTNYAENITTESISAGVYISRSYLNRIFQKYLSVTPHEYLLSVRLSHACRRLEAGESITETALAVGFQDCSSFAATFKRLRGMTPTEYKSKR